MHDLRSSGNRLVLESIDTPILPRPIDCSIPLTPLQLSLWNRVLENGVPLSSLRLAASSVRILGPLNVSLLRRCIQAITRRHESLRTRIVTVDGVPRQQIDADWGGRLELVDLTTVSPDDVEAEARRHAQEFFQARVDLSIGPLFDGKLLELPRDDYVLLLGLDHIVGDGTSLMILSREIWMLYNLGINEQPLSLPPLAAQYADYAVWQQQTFGAWLKKNHAYWSDRLTDAPNLHPPCDNPRSNKPSEACPRMQISLGKALTSALREMGRRERTPLFTIVLTVLAATLSQWCGQRDFLMQFVSHGRSRPELANMIGYIASSLYIRIQIVEQDRFIDLLKRIELEINRAREHQDHGRVPPLYLAKSPPVMGFNWTPASWSPVDWPGTSARQAAKTSGALQIQPFPLPLTPIKQTALQYFDIAPSDTAAGVVFTVVYRSDHFSLARMNWLFENIRLYSEEFAKHPHGLLASLRLTPWPT